MAVTLAELAVLLTGDRSELNKTLDGAEKDTKSWAGRLGSSVTGLVTTAVAGAGIAAVGAIAGIGTAAVNVSNDTRGAAADLSAFLGIPIEKANEFAAVARNVYGNNFAGSVREAGEALGIVAQQLDLAADNPALQTITEDAIALKDVFGVEVGESINAVKVLMDEMGLSSQQATDFIAAGFQNGLNSSDDFLDTIREYGNVFGDAGFSADQFYSILESGNAGGVLGTDKIADSIKEMGVILNEGGDDVRAAFDTIGLSFNDIAARVATGDATWADYFEQIVGGLNNIEDPMTRSQAQVALFGTMAEDLGVNFTNGLSGATTTLTSLEGAADSLNNKYATFGEFFQGLWRKLIVAAAPFTDELLKIANDALPALEAGFETVITIATSLLEVIRLLITGSFQGGIFGLKEDHPAILALIRTRTVVLGAVDVIRTLLGLNPSGGIFGLSEDNQAVRALGSLRDALAGVSKQFFESLGRLPGELQEIFDLILQLTEKALALFAQFWENNGTEVINVIRSTFSIVTEVFTGALAGITGIIKGVLQILNGDWEGGLQTLQDTGRSQLESILRIFTEVFSGIESLVRISLNVLSGIIQAGLGLLPAPFQAFGSAAQQSVQTTFNAIQTVITTVLQLIQGVIQSFLLLLQGDWRGAFENIRNVVINTDLFSVARQLFQQVVTAFQSFDFGSIGRGIVDGIAAGIRNGAGSIRDAARSAAQSALDAAKNLLRIGSPSKEAAEQVGRPYSQGLAEGIVNELDRLRNRIDAGIGDVLLNPIQAPVPALSVPGLGTDQGLPTQTATENRITIQLTQQFYGQIDQDAVRDGSETGLLSALRQVGLA